MFGISRQAYYYRVQRKKRADAKESVVLTLIDSIRAAHPRLGTRKIHHLIEPILAQENLSIGRDALFKVLKENGLLIKRRGSKVPKTTDSRFWTRQYADLYNQTNISEFGRFWVSDITYLPTKEGFVYLALITDVNSRKIIGYNVCKFMNTYGLCIPALNMALEQERFTPGDDRAIIHHSDRGCQYLDRNYIELLMFNQIQISMTQDGDPRHNAIAERVNGILKHEYLIKPLSGFEEAKIQVEKAIKLYNTKRPHNSLLNKTPEEVYNSSKKISPK